MFHLDEFEGKIFVNGKELKKGKKKISAADISRR